MKLTYTIFLVGWLGFSLLWAQASFTPAHAAGGLGILPQPTSTEPSRSRFVYVLKPGEIQDDVVVVNNHSDKPMTVGIETLDAQNTTDGAFTLVTDSKENQDLGTWITPSSDTITIPAGASTEVSFRLVVPNDASVGEHSGAIAVYQKSGSTSGGVGLKILIGARIYVTVPGIVTRKLTFDKVSHEFKDDKLLFHIQTTNQSNVNIEPALDIKLRGLFRTYTQVESRNGTYLPNKTLTLNPVWERRAPWFGYYRVNLILHTWSATEVGADGSKTELPDMTFSYSYGFWMGGIYFIILGALLLLAWLALRFTVWWKDRRKFRTKTDVYVVSQGETIMHISEKTGALPQHIVKFNRLVWPYSLNAKDKLMIPTRLLTGDELYQKYQTEFLPNFFSYLISWRSSLYHPSSRQVSSRAAVGAKRPSSRGRSRKSSRKYDSKK